MKSRMTKTGVGLTLIPSGSRGRVESEAPALPSAEEPNRADSQGMKTIAGAGLHTGRAFPIGVGALSVEIAMLCGLALAQPAPAAEKKPTWESSAFAGLTLTRGNSETLLGNANILTAKK